MKKARAKMSVCQMWHSEERTRVRPSGHRVRQPGIITDPLPTTACAKQRFQRGTWANPAEIHRQISFLNDDYS